MIWFTPGVPFTPGMPFTDWLLQLFVILFLSLQSFTLAVAGERLTKRMRYRTFKALLRQVSSVHTCTKSDSTCKTPQ